MNTNINRNPNPPSSGPRLGVYLTGIAGITAFTAAQSDAAVTAFSFGFGTVLQSGVGTFSYGSPANIATFGKMYSTSSFDLIVGRGAPTSGQLYVDITALYYGTPKFLTPGAVIGTNLNGTLGQARMPAVSGTQSGLLGFRTGGGNFGWAAVTYDFSSSPRSLTVHAAFAETTPGVSLQAGVVPEPGVTGLLAAGAIAAARRRRRALQAA